MKEISFKPKKKGVTERGQNRRDAADADADAVGVASAGGAINSFRKRKRPQRRDARRSIDAHAGPFFFLPLAWSSILLTFFLSRCRS